MNTRGIPVWPNEIALERQATQTLAILTLNSGGILTHGVNRGFEAPMRQVEEETRATYLLSYVPNGERDGKLHSTRVLVTRAGARVRTSEGYLWMTEDQRRERDALRVLRAGALPEDSRLPAGSFVSGGRGAAVRGAGDRGPRFLGALPPPGGAPRGPPGSGSRPEIRR